MALTKKTRERLLSYVLELIDQSDEFIIEKVVKTFNISKTTVYNYLIQLENDHVIRKSGKTKCKFQLVNTVTSFDFKLNNEILEEDRIYSKDIKGLLNEYPNNVKKIWNYSFTEMMNNAIEHSQATNIEIQVFQNALNTTILIFDNGIGIFENIKVYYKYADIETAILELFKGKLTTDATRHSGEGIFFTSRAVDVFLAISSGKVFTHTNYADYMEDLNRTKELNCYENQKGTIIYMKLSNASSKNLSEVFNMFSDVENGFNKTQIPINQIFEGGYPVSRSQARRLSLRFEEFKEVALDFMDVEDIGQGFAHELFVVFQNSNPDIELKTINENEQISRMIHHVKASAGIKS